MIKIVNFIWFLLNCKYFSPSPSPPPGITGDIRLSGGRRTSLDLQIRHWDSSNKTNSQIGSWSPHLGINITSTNTLEINHKGQVRSHKYGGHGILPATTSWWSLSTYYLSKELVDGRYPQPDGGDDTGAALRDGEMSRVLGQRQIRGVCHRSPQPY